MNNPILQCINLAKGNTSISLTRCTRGDARSFFCIYKTYLYAQNYFLKNTFKYCLKSYFKLHEYGNYNSANYDV